MLIKLLIIWNLVYLILTIFGKKEAFRYVSVWCTSLTNCRQRTTHTFIGFG